MFCQNCGNKIEEGNDFCISCGKVVRSEFIQKPQRKFKVSKKSFLIIIGFIFTAGVLSAFTVYQHKNNYQNNEVPTDSGNITGGCTRETRLENKPQYDRALSLIEQRISENNSWSEEYHAGKYSFNHFPANLTNCIQVVEEDLGGSLEGYFVFDSENIKPNYFPVTVDASYSSSDDLTTAILLVHEITHVQQYLNELNNKETLSCVDQEVEAFLSQLHFYSLLNSEENYSLVLRVDGDHEYQHPQISILNTMFEINRNAECDFLDSGCRDKNLYAKLFDIVSSDPNYKNECSL